MIKQILTHHAYTALYLLPPSDQPVTLSVRHKSPLIVWSPCSVHACPEPVLANAVFHKDVLIEGRGCFSLQAFRSTIRDEDGGSAPQENHAMVNMMTAGGAMVHLCASFAADDHSADPWSFYIKVIGTKGSARYSYNGAKDASCEQFV